MIGREDPRRAFGNLLALLLTILLGWRIDAHPLSGEGPAPIELSQEEKAYLSGKKEIRVCDYGEWMPYIGHSGDRTYGILYDFYQHFSRSIGVPIRFTHLPDLESCVEAVRQGSLDAIVSLGKPNTFAEIQLSESFGEDFLAIITRIETPYLESMHRLHGKRVGIKAHYRNLRAHLRENYPDLELVEVPSSSAGLKKVADRELFAFVDLYRVAAYKIRREQVGILKINTKVPSDPRKGHIGVRRDNEVLRGIFDKAIAAMDPREKTRIIDHWMRVEEIYRPDYRLIAEVVAIGLLLLLLFLYYHLRVRYRQKAVLARQAKLAGMGSMIRNIAHQWRQPLARINSNVAVLKHFSRSGKGKEELFQRKLDSIEENTRHMSETIEAFLRFFDPDKQKLSFDLVPCVQKALKLSAIEERKIEVVFDAKPNVKVYNYENELTQVLLIILENAIRVLQERGIAHPRVEISMEEKGGEVLIVICDNGGGVRAREPERIFELHYSEQSEQKGRGVGLYMAKLLTENSMGGTLRLRNETKGACFEIRLPIGEDDD